ncbi:glycosyltransferase [Cryobacterium sp. Y50]|uniref:glycosyltransferase family protein n=1 Tax=Cryobacterium sp. Y50 TaxID=2048286 RepID=UPI000CE5181F|nr:glycosyltransferase [Cryobacterium sp. Y50]
MSSNEAVFISWTTFHGRSEGLARTLGINCIFLEGGRGPALIRYLRLWKKTQAVLRQHKPFAIFVMQPPPIAILSILPYSIRTGARIYGDLHTGVFDDPKWIWLRAPTLYALRRRGAAIVTNESLAEIIRERGGHALVLHDLIEKRSDEGRKSVNVHAQIKTPQDSQEPYVLVPLAYAHDEPLAAILHAAKQTPNFTWKLTGTAPEWMQKSAPRNVVFPGYVSNSEFSRLIHQSAVMVAMTVMENTMQRAGYEALSFGKALVTAPTKVLEEYFGDAALYAAPEATELADQVRMAISKRTELETRMIALRDMKIQEQSHALAQLMLWSKASVTESLTFTESTRR